MFLFFIILFFFFYFLRFFFVHLFFILFKNNALLLLEATYMYHSSIFFNFYFFLYSCLIKNVVFAIIIKYIFNFCFVLFFFHINYHNVTFISIFFVFPICHLISIYLSNWKIWKRISCFFFVWKYFHNCFGNRIII